MKAGMGAWDFGLRGRCRREKAAGGGSKVEDDTAGGRLGSRSRCRDSAWIRVPD